jgi:hypothetical protein
MSSLPAQPLLAAHAAVPDGAARRRGTRGVASLGSVAGCLRRVRGRWHCLYTSVAGRGSVVVLTDWSLLKPEPHPQGRQGQGTECAQTCTKYGWYW